MNIDNVILFLNEFEIYFKYIFFYFILRFLSNKFKIVIDTILNKFNELYMFNHIIKERKYLFKRFTEVMAVYEYNKKIAYNKINITKLFKFKSNNQKLINDEILNECRSEFIHLVCNLCGPVLLKDIVSIKGDMKSVINELSEFFESKIISDDIDSFKNNNPELNEEIEILGIKR